MGWSVWSWRLRMVTSFRGVEAKNLVQEFQTYGYPIWVFKTVGVLKVSSASLLVVSIIFPSTILTLCGAIGMLTFMLVAVISHIKVKDSLSKSIPAISMITFLVCILSCEIYAMDALPPSVDDPSRVALGIVVVGTCFYMWYRSLLNGDYNLDNYEKLDG